MKWPLFCIWMHFLKWKYQNFQWHLNWIFSWASRWHNVSSVKYLEKYLQFWCTGSFQILQSFWMFTGPLFQIKLHLPNTVLLNGFQYSPGALKSLSKAVLGEFDRCGWHSKQSCLQGWANFHRSQAWQIVLVCNTSSVLIQVMTWSHYLNWYWLSSLTHECVTRTGVVTP